MAGCGAAVGDAKAQIEFRERHGIEVGGGKAEFTEGHFELFEGVVWGFALGSNPVFASQAVNFSLLARI